jgi:hypothetical protein
MPRAQRFLFAPFACLQLLDFCDSAPQALADYRVLESVFAMYVSCRSTCLAKQAQHSNSISGSA